jgi:hypothetical protein
VAGVFLVVLVIWLISGVVLDWRYASALGSSESYVAAAPLIKVNSIAWRIGLAALGLVTVTHLNRDRSNPSEL